MSRVWGSVELGGFGGWSGDVINFSPIFLNCFFLFFSFDF